MYDKVSLMSPQELVALDYILTYHNTQHSGICSYYQPVLHVQRAFTEQTQAPELQNSSIVFSLLAEIFEV